ncbi:MAG: MFS transporter, partial [Kiritimatiellae bacterium]|nr:MFS transporter [Kiritimatiellia bacterium]
MSPAAIAMFVLYGLLALVTHLSAPIGAVWKVQPGIDGSNLLGMAGNLMTFAAYLFMGIPSGRLLSTIGYKKTALAALVVGVVGTIVQIASSRLGLSVLPSFAIYLFGTFVCGFSCCMLNIVINPMLNTLGGGGRKGNQLICFGGGVNSIVSTLAPIVVMLLIGTISAKTSLRDVEVLRWWVLGIVAAAFCALRSFDCPEPGEGREPSAARERVL